VADEGTDPEPGEEPHGIAIGSSESPKGRAVKPPSAEAFERWWVLYRDGARSLKKLARAAHISPATAQRAINGGWPDNDLAPLKARAAKFDHESAKAVQSEVDRVRAELTAADTERAREAARLAMQTWTDAAKHALESLSNTSAALNDLGRRISEAGTRVSFERVRRVPAKDLKTGEIKRDAAGNPHLVEETYVDGYRLTLASYVHVRAAREHAHLVRNLLGDINPVVPDPKTGEVPAGGMSGLLVGHSVVTLFLPPNGRDNEDPEDEIIEAPASAAAGASGDDGD
jgi:hypothetical protein